MSIGTNILKKKYDYDNKVPIDENGKPVSYDNKSHNPDRKQYKEFAEGRKKQQLIRAVQKRWNELDNKRSETVSKEF